MDLSEHRFEPFFEGTGPCWCGRGQRHRLHKSERPYPDTPEGKAMHRGIQLGGDANKAYWSLQRRNNLLSLIPFIGRRTHG